MIQIDAKKLDEVLAYCITLSDEIPYDSGYLYSCQNFDLSKEKLHSILTLFVREGLLSAMKINGVQYFSTCSHSEIFLNQGGFRSKYKLEYQKMKSDLLHTRFPKLLLITTVFNIVLAIIQAVFSYL